MKRIKEHYINGEWVTSTGTEMIDVVNPDTEEVFGQIVNGTETDLNRAVAAARNAFTSFAKTTRKERITYLENIITAYENRKADFIETITHELGAPRSISEKVHYEMGLRHFKQAKEELKNFSFEADHASTIVVKEPIGVSGLITPWNFPTNQVATKVASAFAAGCPVVLKPSELTPFTTIILAEVIHDARLPKGVFNLVNGTGEVVGNGISSHPDIDFISFTGSGATGTKINKNAADTIKKVALELGGKSPMIILDDTDMKEAANIALSNVIFNSGQVCTLASRTLIPKDKKDAFLDAVKELLPSFKVGRPNDETSRLGPLISKQQFDRIQYYIHKGIEEGATLFAGGPGKPDGLASGYYVRPTVFSDVRNDMTIAQEEIFGPVMSVITYETIDEAIDIANDTIYGLAGYVVGKDQYKLQEIARHIRAGRITINRGSSDYGAPFGGYKQSGIGREWGAYGIEEYLEVKSIIIGK